MEVVNRREKDVKEIKEKQRKYERREGNKPK